jgi:hypothetical protein
MHLVIEGIIFSMSMVWLDNFTLFFFFLQPKVVCTFPLGLLKAEEVELDEERAIALSGFIGGSLLNGQAT